MSRYAAHCRFEAALRVIFRAWPTTAEAARMVGTKHCTMQRARRDPLASQSSTVRKVLAALPAARREVERRARRGDRCVLCGQRLGPNAAAAARRRHGH